MLPKHGVGAMQILHGVPDDSRMRKRPILSRKLVFGLGAIGLAAFLLYFSPRTGIYGRLAKLFGSDAAMVAVGILLVALVAMGIAAAAYGFGRENESKRPRHRRRSVD